MNSRIGILAALTVLLAACTDSAPPDTVAGGEQQVNTYTQDAQQRPAVAANSAGQAVIVWESYGQDGSHFGIFGQRFLGEQRIGPEFPINSYTIGRQSMPAVAMDGSGNFVVAWRSSLQDGIGGTIYGQRFNADGTRNGNEFRIGPSNSNRDSQSEPSIAMNATGQFAVAWSNRELSAWDTAQGNNNNEKLFLETRAYGVNGTPQTLQPVRIADTDNGDLAPRASRIGIDASGNYVVVWIGGTETAAAVRARHFGSNGGAISPAYDISEARVDTGIDMPGVAMTPSGAFAIAWEGFTYGNVPVGIYLRRFLGPQSALGTAQIVARPDSGMVERATLTVSQDGTYFLAAQADNRISLARIDAGGTVRKLGLVNNPRFASLFPAIAASGETGLLITWQSLGQDGSDRGIYARHANVR
jgi:hypothetical protein